MRQRQVFQSYMYCIYTPLYCIYVLLVLMLLLKCLLLETLSWEVQPCFCVVFTVVVFVLIVVVVFPVSGGPHSSCSSTLNCWSSCWSSSVWRPAWKTKPSPSWVFEACFCRNNQNLNKQPSVWFCCDNSCVFDYKMLNRPIGGWTVAKLPHLCKMNWWHHGARHQIGDTNDIHRTLSVGCDGNI